MKRYKFLAQCSYEGNYYEKGSIHELSLDVVSHLDTATIQEVDVVTPVVETETVIEAQRAVDQEDTKPVKRLKKK